MNQDALHPIETRALSFSYSVLPVIHNVDVAIVPGTITTLVGPNGSGKSTLLKAMSRLLAPQQGAVLLDGKDICDMRTRDIARKLSILSQGPATPEGLTVRELVAYGRAPHQGFLRLGSQDDDVAVQRALGMTGTDEIADRPVDALSGGQRQRAWIAMTVAQETAILFLDEPTTYLDISHQIEVLDLLAALNRTAGRTIIMVLHDLNLAARYSDRMIVLRDGQITADGAPASVMTQAVLNDVFEIEADILVDPRTGRPWLIPRANLGKGRVNRHEHQ